MRNKVIQVMMKNRDGQKEWLQYYSANKFLAKQQAEHDANNTDLLYGTGWLPLLTREIDDE